MAVKLQKRAENTRRKILESAVSGFSGGGFSGTTVEDIAASAGVNKQRIYAYFGSKQKLFEAALLAVFQQTAVVSVEAVRRAAAEPENLTGIMLEDFFRVHEEQPALWRLLAWANLQGIDGAGVLAGVRREENDALRKIFDAAQQQNLILPVKFENWLFTLLAPFNLFDRSSHCINGIHRTDNDRPIV